MPKTTKSTKSAKAAAPAPVAAPASTPTQQPKAQPVRTAVNGGFFLNSANWLLSRLPWFQNRYENWSKAKRIIIAYLLYLIILPVIPIVIAIIMFIHDPEGFKKSKALPILGVIIVAQLSAFGLIATQPATINQPEQTQTDKANAAAKNVDNSDTEDPAKASDAKKSVADKTTSEATNGRTFENCDAAFKAGVFNIARSDPSYSTNLDRDSDGVACEK